MQQKAEPLDDEPSEPTRASDLDLTALGAACGRLVKRWRVLAERIDPYAPPAATAYRQSADDLDKELQQLAETVDLITRFRDELSAQIIERLARERR
jgi:hypothetical protein